MAGFTQAVVLVVAVGSYIVSGGSRGRNILISVKVFLIGPASTLIIVGIFPILEGVGRGGSVGDGKVYNGILGGGEVYSGVRLRGAKIICNAAGPFGFRGQHHYCSFNVERGSALGEGAGWAICSGVGLTLLVPRPLFL